MKLPNLGLRHVALNVQDAQRSKKFYIDIMGMDLEWEPDPDNVYLTSAGFDNLAIHRGPSDSTRPSPLDHIGFVVPNIDDVDRWHDHIVASGAPIVKEIKTHRDGARSFYFKDPDGIVIQLIYHAPIANRAKWSKDS